MLKLSICQLPCFSKYKKKQSLKIQPCPLLRPSTFKWVGRERSTGNEVNDLRDSTRNERKKKKVAENNLTSGTRTHSHAHFHAPANKPSSLAWGFPPLSLDAYVACCVSPSRKEEKTGRRMLMFQSRFPNKICTKLNQNEGIVWHTVFARRKFRGKISEGWRNLIRALKRKGRKKSYLSIVGIDFHAQLETHTMDDSWLFHFP